jgi:hypothetical protein
VGKPAPSRTEVEALRQDHQSSSHLSVLTGILHGHFVGPFHQKTEAQRARDGGLAPLLNSTEETWGLESTLFECGASENRGFFPNFRK